MIYKCKNCSFRSTHIQILHKHQVHHKFMKNAVFECNYLNCSVKFVKYLSFRAHLIRHVRSPSISEPSNINIPKLTCEICKAKLDNNYLFIQHLYIHLKRNVNIKCPISCGLLFHNRSTFTSHLSRKHPNFLEPLTKKSSIPTDCLMDENNCSSNESILSTEDVVMDTVDTDIPEGIEINPVVKAYGDSLLTMSTRHFVADSTLQFMIESNRELTTIYQKSLVDKIENVLLDNNATLDLRNSLIEAINNESTFSSMFDERVGIFRSSYIRKKYFKEKYNYVDFRNINLGRDNDHENCFFQYVPLLDTLTALCNEKQCKDIIFEKKISNPDSLLLRDYTDGSVYKENHFFNSEDVKLELLLYQDCFSLCNPLGAAKKKKILAVYMLLGNLNIEDRSKIDNIQLVLLCEYKHVQHFGMQKIFECVVNDLKKLEEIGIQIQTGASSINIKGSMYAMLGDNLGSHEMLGLSMNFGSKTNCSYWCRYCYIVASDFNENRRAMLGFVPAYILG